MEAGKRVSSNRSKERTTVLSVSSLSRSRYLTYLTFFSIRQKEPYCCCPKRSKPGKEERHGVFQLYRRDSSMIEEEGRIRV